MSRIQALPRWDSGGASSRLHGLVGSQCNMIIIITACHHRDCNNQITFSIQIISTRFSGMCYTLTRVKPEGNSLVHIFLNASLTYIVFVHDPEFFLYTYNPQVSNSFRVIIFEQAVPMTAWIISRSKQFYELSLVDTEHRWRFVDPLWPIQISIFTFVVPHTRRKTWMRTLVGNTQNTAFRQDTFQPNHDMKYIPFMKIPSKMVVAPRYTLLTLFTLPRLLTLFTL